MGNAGISAMPSAQAPANNVNLFEMVRAIYDDTNADWSSADRDQIRQALGVDGSKSSTASGDINTILTSTSTTIPGRLPTSLIAGRIDATMTAIAGNTGSATNLSASAGALLLGTVDTGSFAATTTEFEADDITEATDDHFNNRRIVFTSGDLQYQITEITDYTLTGSNAHFTVVALTSAPANNGTFVIV